MEKYSWVRFLRVEFARVRELLSQMRFFICCFIVDGKEQMFGYGAAARCSQFSSPWLLCARSLSPAFYVEHTAAKCVCSVSRCTIKRVFTWKKGYEKFAPGMACPDLEIRET